MLLRSLLNLRLPMQLTTHTNFTTLNIDICNFLTSTNCHLDVLDLSWNSIGEKGAITFSHALPTNTSLSDLNLASNNIGDTGGQRIVKSLKYHKRIQKFNVSQNDIADGACFVVAQVSVPVHVFFVSTLRSGLFSNVLKVHLLSANLRSFILT